eukprot:1157926-Pelagomonas_calceolata.AAC.4
MSVQSSAGVFTSMISDAAFRCCVGSKIGPPINSGKQPKLQAAQARAVLCIGTLGKERVAQLCLPCPPRARALTGVAARSALGVLQEAGGSCPGECVWGGGGGGALGRQDGKLAVESVMELAEVAGGACTLTSTVKVIAMREALLSSPPEDKCASSRIDLTHLRCYTVRASGSFWFVDALLALMMFADLL